MKNGFRGLPKRRICALSTSISMSGAASTTAPNFLIGGLLAEILIWRRASTVTQLPMECARMLISSALLQFLVEVGQCRRYEHIDPAQKMVLRNAIIEAELVEQLALSRLCRPIIARSSVANLLSRRNHRSVQLSTPLSTASVRSGHWRVDRGSLLLPRKRTSYSAKPLRASLVKMSSFKLWAALWGLS